MMFGSSNGWSASRPSIMPPHAPTASSVRCGAAARAVRSSSDRSEEHTSELQSRPHLVCRLLLEKKKPRQESVGDFRRRELKTEVVIARDGPVMASCLHMHYVYRSIDLYIVAVFGWVVSLSEYVK